MAAPARERERARARRSGYPPEAHADQEEHEWEQVRRQLQTISLKVFNALGPKETGSRREAQEAAARLLAWSHLHTGWSELPILDT